MIDAPQLVRFQRIYALLSDGAHVTGMAMAMKLEVGRATIQRDIDIMRDQLGIPIESSSTPGCAGYYLTEKVKVCQLCSRRHD